MSSFPALPTSATLHTSIAGNAHSLATKCRCVVVPWHVHRLTHSNTFCVWKKKMLAHCSWSYTVYSYSTEFSSVPIVFNLNGYLSIAIDAMPSNQVMTEICFQHKKLFEHDHLNSRLDVLYLFEMHLFVPDTYACTFLICNFPCQTIFLNHTGVCTSITTAICKEETGNAAAAVWWQRMQEDSWRPLMMLVEVEVCWLCSVLLCILSGQIWNYFACSRLDGEA